MIEKEMKIEISNVMEASLVAQLVQTANRFESTIYLKTGEIRVNAKSIMGMLSVGMNHDDKVSIFADGVDEEMAVSAIEDFLSYKA